jgi:hypothetical protein
MNALAKKHLIYISLAFLGFFIYFQWVLDPSLFLIKNYREFFTDIYFFRRFFDFPGSPSEYVSRFLTQLFNIPVIASLVVTVILWSIYWLGFLSFRQEKRNLFLPLLPVFMLIVMHSDYGHSMKFDVDILFLFLSSLVYFRVCRGRNWFTFSIYPVLLAFLLFINGPMTALLFCLLAIASVFTLKKKIVHLPVILFETLVVCLLFHAIFSLSLADFRQELENIIRVYTYGFIPFLLYVSVLISFVLNDYFNIQLLNDEGKFRLPNLKNLIILTGVLIFMIGSFSLTFSHEQKMELSVQYAALNQNWDESLEYSQKCDYLNKNVAYYTNEALYQTGRIYNELFNYSQAFGSEGLIAAEITEYPEFTPNQEVGLKLGALSISVVWGNEATNVYGANPYILKNLTKAYLAEGCIKEAQKMLNLLDHSLFNTEWANQYQKFVDDTSTIKNNAELNGYRRAQLPKAIVSYKSVGQNLYLLAHTSSTNKMAYDYLVISTLLDNEIDNFASCLTGLKVFGYHSIPRLYLEGLLYYSLYSNQIPIDMKEFTFDRDVVNLFGEFRREYSSVKDNPVEAKKKLRAKYGNTYWYYILFQSPITNEERSEAGARMVL